MIRVAAMAAALATSLPMGCGTRPPVPVEAIVAEGLDCLADAEAPGDVERCAQLLAGRAQSAAAEACSAGGVLLAEGVAAALAALRSLR